MLSAEDVLREEIAKSVSPYKRRINELIDVIEKLQTSNQHLAQQLEVLGEENRRLAWEKAQLAQELENLTEVVKMNEKRLYELEKKTTAYAEKLLKFAEKRLKEITEDYVTFLLEEALKEYENDPELADKIREAIKYSKMRLDTLWDWEFNHPYDYLVVKYYTRILFRIADLYEGFCRRLYEETKDEKYLKRAEKSEQVKGELGEVLKGYMEDEWTEKDRELISKDAPASLRQLSLRSGYMYLFVSIFERATKLTVVNDKEEANFIVDALLDEVKWKPLKSNVYSNMQKSQ